MHQKNRMATLVATVQAEMEAKKDHVPRYERFAKADAVLAMRYLCLSPVTGRLRLQLKIRRLTVAP